MNIYKTKHTYINKAGEIKEYIYTVEYKPRIKKYDSLKDKYKDIIYDDNILKSDKVYKIYELEKDNYTIEQIRNLIYRLNKSNNPKHYNNLKILKDKYENLLNDTSIKTTNKIKQIYDKEKDSYEYNNIKRMVYYYISKK